MDMFTVFKTIDELHTEYYTAGENCHDTHDVIRYSERLITLNELKTRLQAKEAEYLEEMSKECNDPMPV